MFSCFVFQIHAQDVVEDKGAFQPPIVVEAFAGQNSAMFQSVTSKQINPGSRFGYFNLINYEANYDRKLIDSYIIQSFFDYNVVKGWKVGLGASFKAFGGFQPIAATTYSYFTKDIGALIQLTYEFNKGGQIEVFSFFEWHPVSGRKLEPYFRVQGLLSFKEEHSFSHHYWRLGAQYKMLRFGPGLNVQYVGPDAKVLTSIGGFCAILIN